VQYLSDEWIEAADEALAAAWESSGDHGDSDGSTTLGYTITAAPRGKTTYHLFAGDHGAGVAAGKPEGDADATMELDYDTAVQIARGETSPQVAFMQGRLKLGGDVTLLIKGAERLSAMGDALASIEGVEY
jgi:putative sterol carrier protein